MDKEEAPFRRDLQFRRALRHVLNAHGADTACDTPDFELADFLAGCLKAYEVAVHSHKKQPPATCG